MRGNSFPSNNPITSQLSWIMIEKLMLDFYHVHFSTFVEWQNAIDLMKWHICCIPWGQARYSLRALFSGFWICLSSCLKAT